MPLCTQALVLAASFSRSSSVRFLRSAALESGTAKPRLTASRASTRSSQAATLGKSSNETPAQSMISFSVLHCHWGGCMFVPREPTVGPRPADDGDVGDGEAVADEEARGGLFELRLEDGVETAGLVGVAVDAVLNPFGRVACSCQRASLDVSSPFSPRYSRLKWLACLLLVSIASFTQEGGGETYPCMGPRPPICHMSCDC